MKYDWNTILDRAVDLHAAELTEAGVAPTLRRLHYLLVSDAAAAAAGYVNTASVYKQLSAKTARGRDAGTFPDLSERTRTVDPASGSRHMPDVAGTVRWIAQSHTLRRDLELPVQIVLLAEKDGVMPLLERRFGWLPRSAVRGYSSLTHNERLAALADPDRPTVGLYLGDYDPSGLDITRALAERLPYSLRRVALNWEQITELDLPPVPAKATDVRTARMLTEHGRAVQVELDAVPTSALLRLVSEAIEDVSEVRLRPDGRPDLPEVDRREADQRARLSELADLVGDALADGGDRR